MRLLLDTHAFIWFVADHPSLSTTAKTLIEFSHLHRLVDLPFHHRAPFDRLLIAQSISDDLPLVCRDATFDAYQVQRLWL